jgi:hypothetical protein
MDNMFICGECGQMGPINELPTKPFDENSILHCKFKELLIKNGFVYNACPVCNSNFILFKLNGNAGCAVTINTESSAPPPPPPPRIDPKDLYDLEPDLKPKEEIKPEKKVNPEILNVIKASDGKFEPNRENTSLYSHTCSTCREVFKSKTFGDTRCKRCISALPKV